MHTPILLALEATSEQQAIQQAEYFNEHSAQWSDWNELGGRWQDEIGGTGVLCYADNPEKFLKLVEEFTKATEREKEAYAKEVGEATISALTAGDDFTRWKARKLLDLVSEEFTPDQHFFDTVHYCANTVGLKERITQNPDQQFIIVWDYHF